MAFAAWLAIVVPSMLAGLAVLWLLAGYYHLRYYVRRRHEPETWKCQPRRFLTGQQQRQAILLSNMNLAIGGLVSGSFIYAMKHGFSPPLYFSVRAYGWLYTAASTALLFVLVDGLGYYAHRLLHTRPLFRHVHHWHHRYVATAPFAVVAMHPVEFLFFQAATFLPLFVIPFHYLSVIAVLVYTLAFNIVDHSGVRLRSRLPWQVPTAFHDDHHLHFHVNFGQHLTLWDRLHGTLRRVNRRYGVNVFGGKGEPAEQDVAPGPGDFVRY
jgi:Delta7-sterol 5-desaturase